MIAGSLRAALVCVIMSFAGAAVAQGYGGLPDGDGQVETFANCTPCHSTMIVTQQRLDRRTWDEVLTWMVEDKGMREMQADVREKVLGYLAEHFGAGVPR